MSRFYDEVRMLSFPEFNGGGYIEIEALRDIPFEIRRVFYIFGRGNMGLVRGKHSNRRSSMVLLNVKGRSKVKTIDENRNEKVYELNGPDRGIYLPRMVWKEMYDFTEDSVLMVLTDEYYDADEYIRDFDSFAAEMKALAEKEEPGAGTGK